MATAGGWLGEFRTRHHIVGDVTWMMLAGLVALAVLIAAVVALPNHGTKTAARQTAGGQTYGGGTGGTTSGSSGNVPGAGSAGITSGGGAGNAGGGGSVGTVPGSTSGGGAPGSAHVSSRFVAARGPGITNSTVYIGVGYSSQSGAGDKAIGAAGAAPSYDLRNVYNAVIDYANAHGGFAGRKLQALFYDLNLSSDFNTQLQAACAYWTQDNKVFDLPGGYDITDACAEKAHAVAIGPGATQTVFTKYPHLVSIHFTAFDRLGQLTVVGVHNAGYFTGKLGLVTWDDPNYREALRVGYIDTLRAKYNITPAQVAYISIPQDIQALGDTTAAVSSAVAKFKSLGIDHVMIQDGNAGVFSGDGLTFEWMNQAKSQRYYPRYGGNSNNSPGFVANPHDEEDPELAVSDSDSDPSDDAGWHTNATREKCFKIEADAGYPVSSSNTNDEGLAAIACDEVFFTQRIINSLSVISADTFVDAVQHLGKTFPSAFVYGTNFFPGRRDGSDMVRTEEYLNSCQCSKYKGPPEYAD
jgi:hypothetical protein